jgi:hypothetical protein
MRLLPAHTEVCPSRRGIITTVHGSESDLNAIRSSVPEPVDLSPRRTRTATLPSADRRLHDRVCSTTSRRRRANLELRSHYQWLHSWLCRGKAVKTGVYGRRSEGSVGISVSAGVPIATLWCPEPNESLPRTLLRTLSPLLRRAPSLYCTHGPSSLCSVLYAPHILSIPHPMTMLSGSQSQSKRRRVPDSPDELHHPWPIYFTGPAHFSFSRCD